MSIWGYIIITVVILYLIGKAKSPKKTKSISSGRSKPAKVTHCETTVEEEAQAIVEKITTEGQVEKLEERCDNALKVYAAATERGTESAQRKLDILNIALDLAYEKTLRYQFTPSLDLHTSKEKLDAAYKVFSLNKIEEAKKLLSNNSNDWFKLIYGDDLNEQPPYLPGLEKYRAIYNSEKSDKKKEEQLRNLTRSDKDFFDEFFIDADEIPLLDQVKIYELEKKGVPSAPKLYEMGCRTFKDCLNANPEEFLKLKGIGPKKQQELINFQNQFSTQ